MADYETVGPRIQSSDFSGVLLNMFICRRHVSSEGKAFRRDFAAKNLGVVGSIKEGNTAFGKKYSPIGEELVPW